LDSGSDVIPCIYITAPSLDCGRETAAECVEREGLNVMRTEEVPRGRRELQTTQTWAFYDLKFSTFPQCCILRGPSWERIVDVVPGGVGARTSG